MQECNSQTKQATTRRYPQPLRLVEALNSGLMDWSRHDCPWKKYDPFGEAWSDGEVKIINARRKGRVPVHVTIQSTKLTPAVRQRITLIKSFVHENITSVHEIFVWNDEIHVVFNSSSMNLNKLAGHPDLTEACLATILAQVRVPYSLLNMSKPTRSSVASHMQSAQGSYSDPSIVPT